MDLVLLYWHWIVFGLALMVTEIFLGSFFIFWFGAAATFVGLLLVPFPELSETTQIMILEFSSKCEHFSYTISSIVPFFKKSL